MARRLATHLPRTRAILDPAAGDGRLLSALVQEGLEPALLHGLDLPDGAGKTPPGELQIRRGDFLAEYVALRRGDPVPHSGPATLHRTYGGIIANPPYDCHEGGYIRTNRRSLKECFGDLGTLNTYSLFLAAAIDLLPEAGVLCFLVPDSFLTARLHRPLRRRILQSCLILELTLPPRRLFHHLGVDVRTAMLLLRKASGEDRAEDRARNQVRTWDRLPEQDQYGDLGRRQEWVQGWFEESPEQNLVVGVPRKLVRTVGAAAARLGDLLSGGAGISTGNDRHFLRPVGDVAGDPDWVPFHKNPGGTGAFWSPPTKAIRRDWEVSRSSARTFIARNTRWYFREGITCSSMGIAFAAAFMPAGGLFGVNCNLFADRSEDLLLWLAYLNSRVASYLLRAVLIRSNIATPGYVKRLPAPTPGPGSAREGVIDLSRRLVELRSSSPNAPIPAEAREEIDRVFLRSLGIETEERTIRDFADQVFERV